MKKLLTIFLTVLVCLPPLTACDNVEVDVSRLVERQGLKYDVLSIRNIAERVGINRGAVQRFLQVA